MDNYSFYPTNADGISPTFSIEYLDNDTEALIEAVALLEEHEGAVKVVIWQGARRVLTCFRLDTLH